MVDIFSHGRMPILAVSRLHLIDPSSIEHKCLLSLIFRCVINIVYQWCSSVNQWTRLFALVVVKTDRVSRWTRNKFRILQSRHESHLPCDEWWWRPLAVSRCQAEFCTSLRSIRLRTGALQRARNTALSTVRDYWLNSDYYYEINRISS